MTIAINIDAPSVVEAFRNLNCVYRIYRNQALSELHAKLLLDREPTPDLLSNAFLELEQLCIETKAQMKPQLQNRLRALKHLHSVGVAADQRRGLEREMSELEHTIRMLSFRLHCVEQVSNVLRQLDAV